VKILDVSYILSFDELLTLLTLAKTQTNECRHFADSVLTDAKLIPLNGLITKGLATRIDGKIRIDTVLRMLIDTIATAETIEERKECWHLKGEHINVNIALYPHIARHIKIIPIQKEGAIYENVS
jgi:hypothetical protein